MARSAARARARSEPVRRDSAPAGGGAAAAALALSIAVLVAGCNALFGVDDLAADPSPSTPGAGGGAASTGTDQSASSSGGGGASASSTGGSAAVSPADWTPALSAVYRFELVGDVGFDSTGHGHGLESTGTTAAALISPGVEGMAALELSPNVVVGSDAPVFAASDALTFGGWFLVDDGELLAGRADGANETGYLLARIAAGGAGACLAGSGAWASAIADAGSFAAGTWAHLACRYEAMPDGAVTIVVSSAGGTMATTQLGELVQTAGKMFGISASAPAAGLNPFAGNADEVFFTTQALSDVAIRRIFACGITGELCACGANEPTQYADCGRAKPDCSMLPPCDQLTPSD